jgi:hypothetical protein
MGELMLKCPTAGQEFSAGIFADGDTCRKLRNTVTKAVCPRCGHLHNWWTREARLSEAGEQRLLAT